MKNVTVTINPTEIRTLSYTNNFTMKPGEKIALNVKSEAAIRPNATNPVAALVAVKVEVTDPNNCIHMIVETITGVNVSTFIDDIEEFIKENYMSVILMSANEKIRSVSALIGVPIRIPNPRFGGTPPMESMAPNGLLQ